MRNTVPSNNDYNNDGSDYNFGTFDDFGVKDYHKEYTQYNIDARCIDARCKGQLRCRKSAKKFLRRCSLNHVILVTGSCPIVEEV